MGQVFFTADTHFGHANILQHTVRHKLWSDVDAMNEGLIERWNSKVRRGDLVYHLGDVLWRPKETLPLLHRLNGKIILIPGNHDDKEVQNCSRFQSVSPLKEVKLDRSHIALCHYRMMIWNRMHDGALHFYGHSHGTLAGNSQCCDVGVDCPQWDYSPVTLDEIRAYLQTQPSQGRNRS